MNSTKISEIEAKRNKILPNFILTNCFQCKGKVVVKYRIPIGEYSKKNNLGYYTEKEEDKDKYFCNRCAFRLYFNEKEKIRKLISSQKKAQHLRAYIHLKKTEFLNKLKNGEDII